MARTVLGRHVLTLVTLCALGACAPASTRPAASAGKHTSVLTCDGDISAAGPDLRAQYDTVKQRIETGPLFRTLVERTGPPTRCVHAAQVGVLRLAYSFAQGARLSMQVDPRIEFSEERADFSGLEEADATTLLQAAEKHAFGTKGCGIDWQKPVTETPGDFGSAREVVFRGDVCNCHARTLHDAGKVTGVLIRSAC